MILTMNQESILIYGKDLRKYEMAQKDVYELFHLFYINYMGPVYELLHKHPLERDIIHACLLYTSDAADEL